MNEAERPVVDIDWPTRQHDTEELALATILCNGPDGQDWMDAQLLARERLPELHDDQQWMLVPIQEVACVLAALDVTDEITDWSEETTFGRLNQRVNDAISDIDPKTAESQRFITALTRESNERE